LAGRARISSVLVDSTTDIAQFIIRAKESSLVGDQNRSTSAVDAPANGASIPQATEARPKPFQKSKGFQQPRLLLKEDLKRVKMPSAAGLRDPDEKEIMDSVAAASRAKKGRTTPLLLCCPDQLLLSTGLSINKLIWKVR
jgi:hypothetical protein